MTIEIRRFEKKDKAILRDFLEVTSDIYRDDPNWVRPLDMDITDRLCPKKNPFFDHAEVASWVAYQDGRRAGRITAQVDHEHLKVHADGAGFFGFFDTIDDAEVAQALLDEAAKWLRSRGMTLMRGPISLSLHEEVGCLIDGFDTPPMMLMTHHLPYQGGLIEQAGLAKAKDLYAWQYDVGKLSKRVTRGYDLIAKLPEVTTRMIDMKRLPEEMALVMDIYNDAWGDNWGFVAATRKEVDKTAEDLGMIAIPELTRLVFIDGEPAALAMAMPNLNEIIRDLKGQLFPFGFIKLFWRLKVRRPKTARLFMLGIRRKWRHARRYAGMSAYLFTVMDEAAGQLGIRQGELSWTLEDNGPINVGIKMMGARIYKTYRVYEKLL